MQNIFKRSLIAVAMIASTLASAGSVDWAHQVSKQTNNGAITVKSVNGASTYANVKQNPTGNAVQTNQSAATQPPLVIIQNSGVDRWSMYYAARAKGLP